MDEIKRGKEGGEIKKVREARKIVGREGNVIKRAIKGSEIKRERGW